ncbi:TPR-2 domain containing protein [Ceratobasidium theobromae]|uniref:TPR-2 domain containing protein n=1 Tax=Ceratobasidium theobromae TaxID=1582974 RepID=A0A5N5QC83_9AGAM|nr:TPR-2 domain containing protein [Ceratobasidium theobromae]
MSSEGEFDGWSSGDSESTEEMGENPQPSVGQSAQFSAGNDIMRYDGAEIDGSAESQILGDFDRKMVEMKSQDGGMQSLGKVWDFTIGDNDLDNFDLQDELREATGIGKRKKGKGRARGPRQVPLSQEVNYFLGKAHDAYGEGDRETAIKHLENVITIEPSVASAWTTLAFCYEDDGDTRRALQLRIMAAHLTGDVDAWVELGLQSRETGSMEQAVYCYRNAVRLDKTNPDVLWDYAFCLRESGQLQKAIKTYESILHILPHDITVLAQLRDLLVQSGDLARAAELYSAAFKHHTSSIARPAIPSIQNDIIIDPLLASMAATVPTIEMGNFGTREVATLADLLSGLGEHARAVEVVIRGAGWLGQVPQVADDYNLGRNLDVNLRMRLAVAKLRLGETDAGKVHTAIILSHDINEFYELHTELADVFFEIGAFPDAVSIYERLACQPHTSSLHVLNRIGLCHKHMKNYAAARDVYQRIIDVDPDEHEAKMRLAEIYDNMNEKRLALDLVNQVIKARGQISARTPELSVSAEASLFAERAPAATSNTTITTKKPANKPALTPAELQRLTRERTDTVNRGFKKLKDISLEEVPGRLDEWLSVAEELVRVFMEEKRLFIADRYKEFSGLKRRPRRGKADDEGGDRVTSGPKVGAAVTDYRGIQLTEWLKFLIQYAFVITKHKGRYAEANDMLNKLSLSNAYQEWKKQNTIWFALLTIAVQEHDVKAIVEYARKLMGRHQFNNDALRLLLVALGGGITAAEAFVDSTLQKYLFREMTLFEKAAKGEPAVFVGGGRNRWDFGSGKPGNEEDADADNAVRNVTSSAAANASNPFPVLPTKESPVYAAAYGQISGGTRSYQTEISYDIEPNDPLICLSLGTACIGRAMQRQADNRNHMVTQGFGFLARYRSLRVGESPLKTEEVDYNLGRGFQQLGGRNPHEIELMLNTHTIGKYRKSPAYGFPRTGELSLPVVTLALNDIIHETSDASTG